MGEILDLCCRIVSPERERERESLKLVNFYPKTLYNCMFFGNFCHNYHKIYYHNYHCNRHTRKTSFLASKKEVQVARNGGEGEVIRAMLERKNFSCVRCSLSCINVIATK